MRFHYFRKNRHLFYFVFPAGKLHGWSWLFALNSYVCCVRLNGDISLLERKIESRKLCERLAQDLTLELSRRRRRLALPVNILERSQFEHIYTSLCQTIYAYEIMYSEDTWVGTNSGVYLFKNR